MDPILERGLMACASLWKPSGARVDEAGELSRPKASQTTLDPEMAA